MFSLAVKLLLRHTERTAVTIMMLVPVVALLASSNMVTSGYVQQAAASVSLVQPSDSYLAFQAGSASLSSSSIGYDDFVRIEGDNVSSAVPLLTFPAVVADGARTEPAPVIATNTSAFVAERDSIVYGTLAETGSQADAGAILAKILGIRLGDSLTVDAFSHPQTLTVVGILNSTDQSDTGLILPLSSAWSSWPQTAGTISYVEFVTPDQATATSIPDMTVIDEEGIDQIARSFDSQTSSLLMNWTYVLLALSAAAAVAAASRVVTEVSQEYNTIRALGARLSTARALVFYELLLVSAVSVLIGVSAGVVSTSVLGALFQAVEGLPLFPSISPAQLLTVGAASFFLILGAGTLSLLWLPSRIGGTGEVP